ncbi:MAG: class I SAM-dependent methyltransferase [Nitrospirae bacterium]|nr:class I SAM-dependent methyltransferase [Nitrospirota bacterium]MCL5285264.1 class I SAM-dependent methyltransferase [Nitrospirota bacterium]
MTTRIDLGCLSLDPRLLEKLELYVQLLLTWNKKIRLTGFSSPDDVRRHLILESILAFLALQDRLPPEFIDFGSGNGTPGLLIGLMAPERHIVLLERIAKKRIFLEYAATRLGLSHIHVLPALDHPVKAPFILMKAITLDDLLSDPAIRAQATPPFTLIRFGTETHPACIPLSSYAITGGVESWGEMTSLSLTESIFQG